MLMNPAIYQALAIAHGLRFYAKTGMKVNRDYTPKNMMAMAARITGATFKARDYVAAANALSNWAKEESCAQ